MVVLQESSVDSQRMADWFGKHEEYIVKIMNEWKNKHVPDGEGKRNRKDRI